MAKSRLILHIIRQLVTAQSVHNLNHDIPLKLNLPSDPYFVSYRNWLVTKLGNPELVNQLLQTPVTTGYLRVNSIAEDFGLDRNILLDLNNIQSKFLFEVPDGGNPLRAVNTDALMKSGTALAEILSLLTREQVSEQEVEPIITNTDPREFTELLVKSLHQGVLYTTLVRHERIRTLIRTIELTLPEIESYLQLLPELNEGIYQYLIDLFIEHFTTELGLEPWQRNIFEGRLLLELVQDIENYPEVHGQVQDLNVLLVERLAEPRFREVILESLITTVTFDDVKIPVTGVTREIAQDMVLLMYRFYYLFTRNEPIDSYQDLLEICYAQTADFGRGTSTGTGIRRSCVGVDFTQGVLKFVWTYFNREVLNGSIVWTKREVET